MQAKTSYWLVAVAVIALTTLALLPSASTTALAGGNIAPINSHPNGATYGQWGARWWQWAFSFPVHNPPYTGPTYNPLFVNGAEDCSLGQIGHVWFIGGVFGISGAASRTCSIPSGTALFFPVLNVVWDNVAVNPPLSIDKLRAAAAGFVASTTELHATIDGTPVPNLSNYRAQSPVFAYTFPPEDNVYQTFGAAVPGADWPTTTVDPAVADGYWLFVHPLPPGVHTLTFGGTFGDPYNFTTEVTYTITVTPGR